MKKTRFAFAAILAVGFLMVSCGNSGNINKVKNGVFSNYDNTITIGKALENNASLKGGKWKAVEMDGRDYVLYTVTFNAPQVSAMIPENIEVLGYGFNLSGGKSLDTIGLKYPNFAVANLFRRHLTSQPFESSMSDEETSQAKQILTKALQRELSDAEYESLEENPLVTTDSYEAVISFIMNQDGTFTTNMIETYTDVTLRCFDNLKVRFCSYKIDDQAYILGSIYKKFNPRLFGRQRI